MTNPIEKKYIVTVVQLAQIVDYCVNMTIAGSGTSKDWQSNVLESIGEHDITTHHLPKIKLESLGKQCRK